MPDAYFMRILLSERFQAESLLNLKDTYSLQEVEYMHMMLDIQEDRDNSVRYDIPTNR